ncbi:MAG: hypothetical protein HY532_09530 [Chloroflexi bacterium]|nr:hypothetical protein [Chloroflexota bacterium]
MAADKRDWCVDGRTFNSKAVVTENQGYSLLNLTTGEYLVYESRQEGVEFGWSGELPGNVGFRSARSPASGVRFGELVAIQVNGGGYLCYRRRRSGIPLGWSASPAFQWEFRDLTLANEENGIGDEVSTSRQVGLYNHVAKAYVLCGDRAKGINLKWKNGPMQQG